MPSIRPRRLVLCLLLGVLSTVGVAWLLAATNDTFGTDRHIVLHRPVGVQGGPDSIWIAQNTGRGSGGWEVSYHLGVVYQHPIEEQSGPPLSIPEWARPVVYSWEGATDEWPAFVPPKLPYAIMANKVRTYGWPLPALYWMSVVKDTSATPYVWSNDGGVVVPWILVSDFMGPKMPLVLPTRPIVRGVVVNTLLYAAVWIGILYGLPAWRTAGRRRRGVCVRCKYDLSGTPGACPECGLQYDRRVQDGGDAAGNAPGASASVGDSSSA